MCLSYSYKIAGRLVATEKCKKGETCYTKHTGNKNKIGLKCSRIQILDSVEMHAFNADQKKKSTNKQQQIDTEGTGDEKTHLRWPISCRPNWKKVSARRGGRFAFCTPIGGGPCFVR